MTLDTKNKTVTPDFGETFGEISAELQKMRPDDWKEYTISPQIVERWNTYPVYPYIPPVDPYPMNPYPYGPIVTWMNDTSNPRSGNFSLITN